MILYSRAGYLKTHQFPQVLPHASTWARALKFLVSCILVVKHGSNAFVWLPNTAP